MITAGASSMDAVRRARERYESYEGWHSPWDAMLPWYREKLIAAAQREIDAESTLLPSSATQNRVGENS